MFSLTYVKHMWYLNHVRSNMYHICLTVVIHIWHILLCNILVSICYVSFRGIGWLYFVILFTIPIERRLNETCDDDVQCSAVTPNSTCNKTTKVCECTEGHLEMLNVCVHGNTGEIFFCASLCINSCMGWNFRKKSGFKFDLVA